MKEDIKEEADTVEFSVSKNNVICLNNYYKKKIKVRITLK